MIDRCSSLTLCGAIVGGGVAAFGGGLIIWRLWKSKTAGDRSYEDPILVDQYMAFHFASPSEYVAYSTLGPKDSMCFPSRCVQLCNKHKNVSVVFVFCHLIN